MAVTETPGVTHDVPNVSIGVLPPLFFGPLGAPNNEAETATMFQLNTESATVLLTATDQA
jgi:hypothetical protein